MTTEKELMNTENPLKLRIRKTMERSMIWILRILFILFLGIVFLIAVKIGGVR